MTLLLAALAAVTLAFDFQGHSVLRVVPETADQVHAVHQHLEGNPAVSGRASCYVRGSLWVPRSPDSSV